VGQRRTRELPFATLLAGAALTASCLGHGTQRVDAPCREMRSAVAWEMLKDNPSIPILDVRLPSDVEATGGRLNRAIAMPLDNLPLRVRELDRFRETTLVVLGKDAEDGGRACQALSLRGFKYVVFVSDGAGGWFKNALPPMQAPPAAPTPEPPSR
jgi:rhodanese-related sulfurtransferase